MPAKRAAKGAAASEKPAKVAKKNGKAKEEAKVAEPVFNPAGPLRDPTTYSDTWTARVTHMHLELALDFATKVITAVAELSVSVLRDSDTLTLDCKQINIKKILANGASLKYVLGEGPSWFGQPLAITLPEGSSTKGSTLVVRIEYETTPECSCVQWMEPSQTAGKKHPYLFSQAQAIHARALFPCQDSPSNKFTYTAAVTVPAPLVALMSALADGEPEKSGDTITYKFRQPVPLPSYLVAVAVGALEKRDISERCAVWSEAEMVEAGAFEFSETEQFLQAAEAVCGPYDWGRYDILLLPPSFPYGGMENPCLTFVTPTLLAGDRSLADVVAHEIAHSWMGNLVTSQNWEHFWMNEGFCVFVERKILSAVHGEKYGHLSAIVGWKALQDSVNQFGCSHCFTQMIPTLDNVDPDDAFSSVPYEKGFNFLWYLQKVVGEEAMNGYIKAHCQHYAHSCVSSYRFKEFFLGYFFDKVPAEKLRAIEWDKWFTDPGMPFIDPEFDTSLVDRARALAEALIKSGGDLPKGKRTPEDDPHKWQSKQVLVFLEKLHSLQKLSFDKAEEAKTDKATAQEAARTVLQKIDALYNFTTSKNSEIRFRWYTTCVEAEMESVGPHVVDLITSQGRMKFIRPLYRSLFNSKFGKALAVDTFKKHVRSYHSIAQKMVAKDLSLPLESLL